jgi:predicted ArsR family transcriptional regulator
VTPPVTSSPVESSRTRLLSTLRGADRAMRVDELCAALGLSANAVRFQLARLVAEGAVRDEHLPATGPGRPAIAYRAVPEEAVDEAAAYRSLARVLGDALGSLATPAELAEVGERWARHHRPVPAGRGDSRAAALDRVVALLDDLGFAPELADGGRTVELHRCTYFRLAVEQPQVVCALHLGMVRGAMGDQADDVGLDLTPVLDGSAPCLLHVRPRVPRDVPTRATRTDTEEHPS